MLAVAVTIDLKSERVGVDRPAGSYGNVAWAVTYRTEQRDVRSREKLILFCSYLNNCFVEIVSFFSLVPQNEALSVITFLLIQAGASLVAIISVFAHWQQYATYDK